MRSLSFTACNTMAATQRARSEGTTATILPARGLLSSLPQRVGQADGGQAMTPYEVELANGTTLRVDAPDQLQAVDIARERTDDESFFPVQPTTEADQ